MEAVERKSHWVEFCESAGPARSRKTIVERSIENDDTISGYRQPYGFGTISARET
jgi:hypothetical protein